MAFLQNVETTTSVSTVTYTSATIAKSLLILAVRSNFAGPVLVTGATDTQGNTWHVLYSAQNTTVTISFLYAFNTAGGSAPTVTLSWSGTPAGIRISAGEYSSGVAAPYSILRANDASPGGAFTSSSSYGPSGTITPNSGDLVIGFQSNVNNSTVPTGATNGFTYRSGAPGYTGFGDKVSDGAAVNVTFTGGAAGNTGSTGIVAFGFVVAARRRALMGVGV